MVVRKLSSLSKGEGGRVFRIDSGRMLRGRLLSLGFGTGVEIRVIKRGMPGPFIVEVLGCCRVALGAGEASRVLVEVGE
jgi:Fe2+ transport system protein FeoA